MQEAHRVLLSRPQVDFAWYARSSAANQFSRAIPLRHLLGRQPSVRLTAEKKFSTAGVGGSSSVFYRPVWSNVL
jgi:hypothetical protein